MDLRTRLLRGAVPALALALALTGCSTTTERPAGSSVSPTADRAPAAGTPTREELRVDGRTRTYLLHRPTTPPVDGTRPPLVIAFHGRGGTAPELREQSRLDRDAKARGMVIAYPEGLDKAWAAGTQATPQRPDPDLDVRFTEALIAELVRDQRADPERVYVTGFSMGGSMALRMAADRPDLLAGAAAVSGELPTGAAEVRPTGTVPVMIVYGTDDPVRPIDGLPSPSPVAGEPVTPTRSARSSAELFAKAGGAGAPTTRAERGYDRTVWRLGGSAGTVQFLAVHDAGHTWPGSTITPPKGFGRTSRALDATSTVLDFFAESH
ncbi:dienelactone hydrolase family protein [Streptomyces lincolnensis]|uniref:alpha/beta hydrolase family esterase n=1 Tax=Streptomyces lincolnensis TaxID=1915 RepID=UPI001E3824C3|nr:PHB depolymerase family esterase [Streptomyces lincolnensis]MCD7443584.1 dienelactone hydrolase family protein [Streptomyces lincolnensis]